MQIAAPYPVRKMTKPRIKEGRFDVKPLPKTTHYLAEIMRIMGIRVRTQAVEEAIEKFALSIGARPYVPPMPSTTDAPPSSES